MGDPNNQNNFVSNGIVYSDRYADDLYEYRHVVLPAHLATTLPRTRLLTESEWRNVGVMQSPDWCHYLIHTPEPHILLFRRAKSSPTPSDFGRAHELNAARNNHNNINEHMLVDFQDGHIPRHFRTADLRNFFSQSIESEDTFECFNYRHRPAPNNATFNTCICRVRAHRFDQLHTLYHNKNWIDRDGQLQASRCVIFKIKANNTSTDNEAANIEEDEEEVKLGVDDLDKLLEFQRIPAWMPQGNVGTPTRIFVTYINRCQMPQSLITKLGINLAHFRKHRKKRAYSNVQYKYEDEENDDDDDEKDNNGYDEEDAECNKEVENLTDLSVARTATGEQISESIEDATKIRELNYEKLVESKRTFMEKRIGEDGRKADLEDEDEGDDLEEWERHEALHDDVTKQDRTSPYFFEHEIELKWEKGGSGLVFYTDDVFWKEHEGKDFDAETADDLDVDVSMYYNGEPGDKDAQDLLEINKMEMLRSGADSSLINDESKKTKRNVFHGNDFGRRVLEKAGWRDGEPIGLKNGLVSALDASDGKAPLDKTGLGFHGEKVDRERLTRMHREREESRRRAQPYYIATKYDLEPSQPDSLLRCNEFPMKHATRNKNDTKK